MSDIDSAAGRAIMAAIDEALRLADEIDRPLVAVHLSAARDALQDRRWSRDDLEGPGL